MSNKTFTYRSKIIWFTFLVAFLVQPVAVLCQSKNLEQNKSLFTIVSSPPSYLLEGDQIEWVYSIVNQTEKEITGQVSFELKDAETNVSVDGWFQNVFPAQYFTVAGKKAVVVKFPIQVPFSFNKTLFCKIIARSGNFKNESKTSIPVIAKRMLFTETLPIEIKKDTIQKFGFLNLTEPESETLTHAGLSFEFAQNPVWYAIDGIATLMELPDENLVETFHHFFASCLAQYISRKFPTIKKELEQIKKTNEHPRTDIRMNHTGDHFPWTANTKTSNDKIAFLSLQFDPTNISTQINNSLLKFLSYQLPNGGFSWLKNGDVDLPLTNYILSGIERLKKINAIPNSLNTKLQAAKDKAIKFCAINNDVNIFSSKRYGGLKDSDTLSASSATSLLEMMEEARMYNKQRFTFDTLKLRIIHDKKPNGWISNILTADACYALILHAVDDTIKLHNFHFTFGDQRKKMEANASEYEYPYHYQLIDGKEIGQVATDLTIEAKKYPGTNPDQMFGSGNLFWQYYEETKEKQQPSKDIELKKTYWKVVHSQKKNFVTEISDGDELKKGDTVIIKLEIRSGKAYRHLQIDEQLSAAMKILATQKNGTNKDQTHYRKYRTITGNRIYIEKSDRDNLLIEEKVVLNQIGIFHTGITVAQDLYFPEVREMIDGIKIRVIE